MSSHSTTSFQPETANIPAGPNDLDDQKGHKGDAVPATARDIRQLDEVDPHGGSALDDQEEEEDGFDLNDPYFRSRSASAGVLTSLAGFSAPPGEEGGQVQREDQPEQVSDRFNEARIPSKTQYYTSLHDSCPRLLAALRCWPSRIH